MYELPLFPLNSVLFPGMPLSLRIFEERYKLMINMCIEKRDPFGVVLIANNVRDTHSRAQPHMIGCTAQITQVQPLGEGQMNITAVGKDRFQIVSLNTDQPYLVGQVEDYPMQSGKVDTTINGATHLRSLLENYLHILEKAGQVQFTAAHLPQDPLALAYLSAVVIQDVTHEQKQSLLEIQYTSTFIYMLRRLYHLEIQLLNFMASPPDNIDFNGRFALS